MHKFVFNHRQKTGVLGLVCIILILSGVNIWVKTQQPFLKENDVDFTPDSIAQYFIDSLKLVAQEEHSKEKIYPFNPNFITDYKGYTLGMSTEEIDRLLAYRAKDQWINSVEEFQNVTRVSDSLLAEISPLFKFPDWVTEKEEQQKQQVETPENVEVNKKDLNEVTAEELQEIKGIGEVLSTRIVRHRNKLGGFVDDIQLKDIYGLKYEVRQRVLEKYTVHSKQKNERLDINKAGVVDLIEVFYIDYELARKIVSYRETHEGIESFEELTKIESFPAHRIEQIQLYLKIEKL